MGKIVLVAAVVLAASTACGPVRTPSTASANTCESVAPRASSSDRPAAVADATKAFLSTLDDDQRGTAADPGVRLETLSAVQRAAALGVLKVGLSDSGYQQVLHITGAAIADYRIRVLGTPVSTQPWTVRFDGPGLSLDVTVAGPTITVSPPALNAPTGAPPC
ncbi:DUF3500 domain-containing protein [Dactylosporangium sp. NPDC051541]|uniref:DUF3500 domain-containing protein n=1 Tax=Dactylosporangium sp. NPDC051541 TaxID=3363977 RepID=UPI0037B56C40